MGGLAREAVDLVLDGRAIARAHPFDDSGEHWRSIEAAPDDLVGAMVRVRDPAAHLARMRCTRAHEREDRLRSIARLFLELGVIDSAAVDTGRRPGLQAPHWKGQLAQARRQRDRRGVSGTPSLEAREADVNEAAQECAGGQDNALAVEPQAHRRNRTSDAFAFDNQVVHGRLEQPQVRLRFEAAADGRPIQRAVRLGPRGPHSGPFAAIERPELDSRLVRGGGHGATQRIDLLHQVALADPPIEGLQDIWPRVSRACVSSSVRAPVRAAARAASVPA